MLLKRFDQRPQHSMNIATQPPVFLRKGEICSHYCHTCHLSVLPHSTRPLTYPSIYLLHVQFLPVNTKGDSFLYNYCNLVI